MAQKSDADSAIDFDGRPSSERGRDSVTDAVEAYMLNGHVAVSEWIAGASTREGRALVPSYLLGACIVHSAELIAQAMDRLAASMPKC